MEDDRRPNIEGHDLTEERPVGPHDEAPGVERQSPDRPRPHLRGGVERETPAADAVEPEAHPDPAMQGTPQPDGDPGQVTRSGGLQPEARDVDLDH